MISTHILDTHLGKPAANVKVKLFNEHSVLITEARTNGDGRISSEDFALTELKEGNYSLSFAIGSYFDHLKIETFFPKVVIHFTIKNDQQHYHIPLLISPFAYSTYRGS